MKGPVLRLHILENNGCSAPLKDNSKTFVLLKIRIMAYYFKIYYKVGLRLYIMPYIYLYNI